MRNLTDQWRLGGFELAAPFWRRRQWQRHRHGVWLDGLRHPGRSAVPAKVGVASEGTPAFDAHDMAHAAYVAEDPRAALGLVRGALAIDPACIDALALRARLDSPSSRSQIERLEQIQQSCFEALRQRGWTAAGEQSLTRVWLLLAQTLWDAGRRVDALSRFEALLARQGEDRPGLHDQLIAGWLACNDLDRVRVLLRIHVDDGSLVFPWSLVLATFLSGDVLAARDRCADAHAKNPQVRPLLSGRFRIPPMLPEDSQQAQAVGCAIVLREAWRCHPAAVRWLKRQGRH